MSAPPTHEELETIVAEALDRGWTLNEIYDELIQSGVTPQGHPQRPLRAILTALSGRKRRQGQ